MTSGVNILAWGLFLQHQAWGLSLQNQAWQALPNLALVDQGQSAFAEWPPGIGGL